MYNIVDLIAEVSGIADIMLVIANFIMTSHFSKRMLDRFIVQHISKVMLVEDEPSQKVQTNISYKDMILAAANEIKKRFRLQLTLW